MPDADAPDLQAIVEAIHAELAPRFGAGAGRLHPPARPRRPAPLRPRGRGPRRHQPTPRATPRWRSRSRASPRSSCSRSRSASTARASGPRSGASPRALAFNSIVQLELEQGRPRNPFINAGAIIVTDLVLAGHSPREAIGEILRFLRFLADDEDHRGSTPRSPAPSRRPAARNFALASSCAPSTGWSIRSTRCSVSISTTAPSR